MCVDRKIEIAGFNRARRIKRKGFSGIITIEDPDIKLNYQLRFYSKPYPKHLILQFKDLDVEVPEIRTPRREDVAAAMNFASGVNGPLLIHCFAGISRSTAIALAIIASEMPKGSEQKALSALLALAPNAVPNLLIVKYADDILELDGALISAIRNWDAGLPSNQRRRALNQASILLDYARNGNL